ncbi:cation transporter [Flavobacterium sp. '19STA2R22 D10 B1']|uniref:cation transporter n=1 Tax=Flavobacterium aerium TaxID=3037261 RepID=UPI00278BC60C|nr:cation transporter [Flavobacterium sp. '19STA2R22 D10 B1']
MMKKMFFILVFTVMGITAQAQEKSKNAKYDVEVKGNCELCKKRIEKVAFSVSGVKSAVWNPEDKKLHVILNEQKNDLVAVKKAVAKVGHDADDVKATDDDYSKLHHCCLYER